MQRHSLTLHCRWRYRTTPRTRTCAAPQGKPVLTKHWFWAPSHFCLVPFHVIVVLVNCLVLSCLPDILFKRCFWLLVFTSHECSSPKTSSLDAAVFVHDETCTMLSCNRHLSASFECDALPSSDSTRALTHPILPGPYKEAAGCRQQQRRGGVESKGGGSIVVNVPAQLFKTHFL